MASSPPTPPDRDSRNPEQPRGRRLSGRPPGGPLVIRSIHALTRGKLPIVGVGALRALGCPEKLQAGATLVQLYTGLVYRPGDRPRILRGLD
jgi:dihydroorotate dehydrogenase